jgi:hypothetical protein
MRRILLSSVLTMLLMTVSAQAQVGMPGIAYSSSIAAGDGGQLYPYDQQDPWLHGQFQRVPAYGGFASFRPYNYRHVFAQTQISSGWGAAHGMPYSHQFWNKYRTPYMQGNLHSSNSTSESTNLPNSIHYQPIYQTGYNAPQFGGSNANSGHSNGNAQSAPGAPVEKSIHIFPTTLPVQ